MLQGLNHLTITVSDLERSRAFYQELLGFQCHVTWNRGAYLSLGDLWLCLALGEAHPAEDYSHIALTVRAEDFATVAARLAREQVHQWQPNASEGASLYLSDPDGIKLEIHVGSLQSRLEHLKENPYPGLVWHTPKD